MGNTFTLSGTHSHEEIRPVINEALIEAVSSEQMLNGERTADVWAECASAEDDKVWVLITPPDRVQEAPGCSVTGLPAIVLDYNSDSGRYEGTYACFSTCGKYDITFYAKDSEGNISLPAATSVIQNIGMTGNVNGDCEVDLADVLLVLKVLAEEDAGLIQDHAASGADVNGDHKIGMEEAIHILRHVAGL